MKKINFLCIALLVLSGCYIQNPGMSEVYSWNPPSDDELKLRRFRQNELDEITAEMERRIFTNEDLAHDMQDLQTSVQQAEVELAKLETQGAAKLAAMEERYKNLQMSAAELKSSSEAVEEGILKVKRDRVNRELSRKNYAAAVQFFKDGKFDLSISSFKKALSLNPGALADKMHFGISSAYFKMKKFEKAVANFDILVNKFPKSDKWYISSVLLGWIYNNMGEKSKAIFVLENALQKNPPETVSPLLSRLLRVVQEESKNGEG